MKKGKNKLVKRPHELLRSQGGFSVLAIIFVMLVLSAVGYSLAKTMANKQKSVPVTAQSNNAFFMAESGINYAGKQLSERFLWSSLSTQQIDIGNDSFTIVYNYDGNYCTPPNCSEGSTKVCISIKAIGESGEGERVITSRFCREQVGGCLP